MGEHTFADRLERLRKDGAIWVAPALGLDRWAVFAEALGLIRRIYVRRQALLDPVVHLYPQTTPMVPDASQRALASLSLAGALRHELAHHEGMVDEEDAYATETAWYEGIRASPWIASLPSDRRRAYEWAIESAILNARRASARAAD